VGVDGGYVPAGTPRPIIDRLNTLVREAVSSEAYRTLTRTTYGVPFSGSPEELAAFQASETKKWARSSSWRECRSHKKH